MVQCCTCVFVRLRAQKIDEMVSRGCCGTRRQESTYAAVPHVAASYVTLSGCAAKGGLNLEQDEGEPLTSSRRCCASGYGKRCRYRHRHPYRSWSRHRHRHRHRSLWSRSRSRSRSRSLPAAGSGSRDQMCTATGNSCERGGPRCLEDRVVGGSETIRNRLRGSGL